jgi:hypothetical protein
MKSKNYNTIYIFMAIACQCFMINGNASVISQPNFTGKCPSVSALKNGQPFSSVSNRKTTSENALLYRKWFSILHKWCLVDT